MRHLTLFARRNFPSFVIDRRSETISKTDKSFLSVRSRFKVEMKGLTGVIKFDNQGFRSSFSLDIIELGKDGLRKIGTWNTSEGVNLTRTYGEVYTQIVESLHNKTFIVTTILVS